MLSSCSISTKVKRRLRELWSIYFSASFSPNIFLVQHPSLRTHRYVKWHASEPWECQAERPVDRSWVADVLKLMDYYAERTPGKREVLWLCVLPSALTDKDLHSHDFFLISFWLLLTLFNFNWWVYALNGRVVVALKFKKKQAR